MSVLISEKEPVVLESFPRPAARRRPLVRQMMQLIRRLHLYLGLCLFPWALLYGVTGFLFNHPTFLADAPTCKFSAADLVGTPLEMAPTPEEQAMAVLKALNERHKPAVPYKMGPGHAHYGSRDTFVATVQADGRSFFVVYDPRSRSGTIRETTPSAASEKAPFATGVAQPPRQRGMGMMGPMKHDPQGIQVEESIVDVLKAGLPLLMERMGFPRGNVIVTTAPDIKFPVDVAGELWTATYNPVTTTVTGIRGPERSDLSVRSFLLRLHLSRGYPGALTTKWYWAVGVDAIALALCFWAISGLLMWWQIKATRKLGVILVCASSIIAAILGFSMHGLLSQ
jgi:hypothetical protein